MASESKKEEKIRKNVKEILDEKMDSYGVTKKTLYSLLGIFGCLVLTVVMSITGMGFDKTIFLSLNYWTGMVIQFGIAIFSMITGRQIGDDTQRNKPDGQYRKELGFYRTEYKRIDEKNEIDYFEGWLESYKDRKLDEKIRTTVKEFGIKQIEVLDLDLTELKELSHPYKKDWNGTPFYEKYYDPKKGKSETTFQSLSKEQIEAVRQIKKGAITVADVSSSYFMNALKGTSVDEWERAARSDKKKGTKVAVGYAYRIFGMLVLSVIANGIFPQPYEKQGAVALNIAMRIFVLVTSAVWGIYLGFKVVEMDMVFLAYKTHVIKMFRNELESGEYRPLTIEEQAELDLKKYEEEKEAARKSVVDPEVIEPTDGAGMMLIGGATDERDG